MAYQDEIEKVRKDIKNQQAKLAELEAKEQSFSNNEPRAIAEYLHEKECTWNHTDGCGWYYESWSGNGAGNSTRMGWLRKAEKLIALAKRNNIPINIALEIRAL